MLASNMMCDAGDLRAAEACLLRLLQMPRDGITLGDDPGLRSFKARCQLGRIYRDQKRLQEAETQWRAALDEKPDYPQAWLGLGQVLLDQNRWGELEEVVNRLEASPEGAVEAAVLRGLRLAVTRETALARQLMEETIARHPRAIEPRLLLGRLLMRDGDNGSAAVDVYQEILRLDPAHGEASRNLKTLQNARP
jgi:cytochrome c-type biogenesis protein CcmH/NrfG